MSNKIFVSAEDKFGMSSYIPHVEPFLQKVLDALGYDNQEVSVFFCGDSMMKDLNKKYRDIDSTTDVLSFENGETYKDDNEIIWKIAGDIVISLETLPKNADYFGITENEEMKRLLIHGILHLNGEDHGEEHIEIGKLPVCSMLIKQEKLLKQFDGEVL